MHGAFVPLKQLQHSGSIMSNKNHKSLAEPVTLRLLPDEILSPERGRE